MKKVGWYPLSVIIGVMFLMGLGSLTGVAQAAAGPTPTPAPLHPPAVIGVNPYPTAAVLPTSEAEGGVLPSAGVSVDPGGRAAGNVPQGTNEAGPPPGVRSGGGSLGRSASGGNKAEKPTSPGGAQGASPTTKTLAVPQQWQDDETQCGAASLAMVLGYYSDGQGPQVAEVARWLRERGLLYHTGTGVEELAYAARAWGYGGSRPIYGWDMGKLKKTVESGRPVVVNLGVNGAGGPGHMVVVVGFSADGKRVIVRDPALGQREMATDEFEALWQLRGRSGLVVARQGKGPDPLGKWVELFGVLAGLSLALGRYGRRLGEEERRRLAAVRAGLRGWLSRPERLGLGAGLWRPRYREVEHKEPVYGWVWKTRYRTMRQRVPTYGWVWQTRYRRVRQRVPTYGWVWQTRYRRVRQRVPTYGWVWRTRYRTVRRRVPRYRRVWSVVRWRTRVRYVRQRRYRWERRTSWRREVRWERRTSWRRVTSWFRRGWRWFRRTVWRPVTRWVRRVVWRPVTRWVRRAYTVVRRVVERVPEYGWKWVRAGWKWVTRRIPERVRVWAQTGWKWVTRWIPERVRVWAQRGWKWVTRRVPERVRVWAQTGWKWVTRQVPERVRVWARTGWRIVRKKVPIGRPGHWNLGAGWWRRIVHRARRVYHAVWHRARRAYHVVRHRVRRVYHAVRHHARRVYHAVRHRARRAYHAVRYHARRVYHAVRHRVRRVYHAVRHRARRVYHAVRHRARRVYHAVRHRVQQLLSWGKGWWQRLSDWLSSKRLEMAQRLPDQPPWPWWGSLIPLLGDGSDLIYEMLKKLVGKKMDPLNVGFSVAGLVLDGPEDGVAAGDIGVALIKKVLRALRRRERKALIELSKEIGNDTVVKGMALAMKEGGEEGVYMLARLAAEDRRATQRLLKGLLEGDAEARVLLRQGDLTALLKRYSTQWNAKQLRQAMIEAGKAIPPRWHVHHIVPSTHGDDFAIEARKILKRWGIDINDAVNGVALPPDVHPRVHTKEYMEAVLEALNKAQSREEVIWVLEDIARTLRGKGRYP